MRTQVAIVGAGPAGLLLSHLLHLRGIDSVVLERRSETYVQERVRAGLLEQGTTDLLREAGVGAGLDREGIVHEGLRLCFDRTMHRIPLTELTGRHVTVYGQQKVVRDLIAARRADGGAVHFEVDDVTVSGIEEDSPVLRATIDGRQVEIDCDFVAGCDGSHGICRDRISAGHARTYEYTYPFGWLGILAEVAPSTDELIYAFHDNGFALHSLRSAEVSRLYLQVDPDEPIENWPDDRIWSELQTRLGTDDGFALREGPIIDKSITPVRSFVTEPMQYGRLFLAGDAAHIVPPTGAKGLNLAVADVRVLAEAFDDWYARGRSQALDGYSDTCLRRVWRAQDFSYWMTSMLHRMPGDSGVQARMQLSRLRYVVESPAAARSLAENYVGYAPG
ncbi:p-hydroxybenzoate 3-monooxygenase [Haloechinothrix alba]|uniref:p-hydroxybenzoate 3-monooxygenase n=1 Tax=Haloechinothrix alba TaxID=664784 RepID=A0A238WSJ4_9PSEU|nr:4-hydroxybenzoate 3-monooxygenase [Haloechinothrix alba]SNR49358.1 p-hydroxybenzoate 3-monooxygenase [Haloechinothrix alba]